MTPPSSIGSTRCNVIFHTAQDMTTVLRERAAEGWDLSPAALGSLWPYITEPIKRFGEYAADGLAIPPAAFDARVNLRQDAADQTTRVADQAA